MSFDVANIWQKIDNSKSSSAKFRQKVDFFFEEVTRIGRVCVVVLCVLQLEESSVCVDVEVVCVCRPSSRLSLNIRPCNDFNPYL